MKVSDLLEATAEEHNRAFADMRALIKKWKTISQTISNEVAKATDSYSQVAFVGYGLINGAKAMGVVDVCVPWQRKERAGNHMLSKDELRVLEKKHVDALFASAWKKAEPIVYQHIKGVKLTSMTMNLPVTRLGKKVLCMSRYIYPTNDDMEYELTELISAQHSVKPSGFVPTATEGKP